MTIMVCADSAFFDHSQARLPRLQCFSGCLPCWQRLERIDWKAGLTFECYGGRFGLRSTDPALRPRLFSRLPPGSCPASSGFVDDLYSLHAAKAPPSLGTRSFHLLYRGVTRIARTIDLEIALAAWESDLHAQVAARARDFLFVHAGVVGWRGSAIVIPGRSFSGKTNLTAALVRRGAEYFSDEYAVFDMQGCVHPYPKLLSFRDAAGQPQEKRSAESLGGMTAGSPLPVGLILDTKYMPGGHWRPRSVSPGRALFSLLDNTVQIRRQPEWALAVLERVAAGASAVRSRRGDAGSVADWVIASAADTLPLRSSKD